MMNELLIASICAGMSGPADMCSKTVEAASKQAGVHQTVENAERQTAAIAENKAKKTLGKDVYSVLAYGVVATKVGAGGTGSVKMNGGPLCDKITITGSKNTGSLGLGWSF